MRAVAFKVKAQKGHYPADRLQKLKEEGENEDLNPNFRKINMT